MFQSWNWSYIVSLTILSVIFASFGMQFQMEVYGTNFFGDSSYFLLLMLLLVLVGIISSTAGLFGQKWAKLVTVLVLVLFIPLSLISFIFVGDIGLAGFFMSLLALPFVCLVAAFIGRYG